MIQANNIVFSYGQTPVLQNLSVEIRRGAITTLMGANGCGKTTLLHLLTKNLTPASGSVLLDDVDITQISRRQFARKAAIVHQKNTAPDDLTVERLVGYGRLPYTSMLRPTLDAENRKHVERALALTDLTALRARRMGQLSGGQRQRAFLAMALAQDTTLLFLDEPTTFLDVRYQVEMLRLIQRLNREQGITIVMVLHDINQALTYSDEVIGVADGRVVAQGAPEAVIDSAVLKTLYGIALPVRRVDGRLCVMAI